MRDMVFDRILQRHFEHMSTGVKPGSPHGRPSMGERDKSGTTIIGFYYKDGIMLAADRKTTEGWLGIKSLESIKIHQVDFFTGVLFAGYVGDIQFVLKKLKDAVATFKGNYDYTLTVAGQVNFLTLLFRDYMDYVWPLQAVVLIAGSNLTGGLEMYEISLDGSKYRNELYIAEGSGGKDADSVLHDARKSIRDRSLTFDDAVSLAVRAIYKSGVKDSGSSDIRVATPKVAIISKENGFSFVDDNTVKQVAEQVIIDEGGKDV